MNREIKKVNNGSWTIREDGKVVGSISRRNGEYAVHFFHGFAYYRDTWEAAEAVALNSQAGTEKNQPTLQGLGFTAKPSTPAKPKGKPKFYFAYGANTDVASMALRCPTAVKVGRGTLSDWRLEFRGPADIVKAKGEVVEGAVWLIHASDEATLDSFEGYPTSYTKKTVSITPDPSWGEEPITAMVYVMTETRRRRQYLPGDSYVFTLLRGYKEFGLNKRQIEIAVGNAMVEAVNHADEYVEPKVSKKVVRYAGTNYGKGEVYWD